MEVRQLPGWSKRTTSPCGRNYRAPVSSCSHFCANQGVTCRLSRPKRPKSFNSEWDTDHPDGGHVYAEADKEGHIDPDSFTEEPPYDTGDDEGDANEDDD